MKTKQIVTCTDKQVIKSTIIITYKYGRQTKIMGVPEMSPDYEMAKKLKPNDKFEIELRDTEITPIPGKFDIKPEICPLEYITKIISSR